MDPKLTERTRTRKTRTRNFSDPDPDSNFFRVLPTLIYTGVITFVSKITFCYIYMYIYIFGYFVSQTKLFCRNNLQKILFFLPRENFGPEVGGPEIFQVPVPNFFRDLPTLHEAHGSDARTVQGWHF